MPRRPRPLLLAALLVLLPARVWASAEDLFGVGPRDVAMAGAAEALGDHPGAVYYDPAAMAEAPRLRFSALYLEADPALTVDGASVSQALPLHATSFGFVLPVPLKGKAADRLAVGAALESPTDRLIRVYSIPATTPQLVLLQNDSQILGFYVALSAKLQRNWAVGGGVRLAANVSAKVSFISGDKNLDETANGFLTTTFTPYFSVRFAPPDGRLRLALTGRQKFQQYFATPASSSIDGVSSPTPGVEATTQFVPAELVLGGGYALPAWWLELDLAYRRWSEFPDPTLPFGRVPTSIAPFPSFHDTLSPRVGVERTIAGGGRVAWAVRGGYRYEPSPAPNMATAYNLLDNDRHVLAAGVGVTLPWKSGHVRFDGALEDTLLASRTQNKDPASCPSTTVGCGSPSHTSSGSIPAGTLGITWEY